jgi:hypothetical protein
MTKLFRLAALLFCVLPSLLVLFTMIRWDAFGWVGVCAVFFSIIAFACHFLSVADQQHISAAYLSSAFFAYLALTIGITFFVVFGSCLYEFGHSGH